jgi:hypothetical protein
MVAGRVLELDWPTERSLVSVVAPTAEGAPGAADRAAKGKGQEFDRLYVGGSKNEASPASELEGPGGGVPCRGLLSLYPFHSPLDH